MNKSIKGSFVKVNGEEYYKISNYDKMKPFLFTLANSSDIWIYLSSNGGITAGRGNIKKPLFPYVCEDKIYTMNDTGAKTIIRIKKGANEYLWQPFEKSYIGRYNLSRSIYKSVLGNDVIFEEINNDLKMKFTYRWQCCEKYGIVKSAMLENIGDTEAEAEVIDGLINIMPFGVEPISQENMSCLVDGYKCTELYENLPLALYTLTTAIVDTATPEEMLTANIVWSICDIKAQIYIDEDIIDSFAHGEEMQEKNVLCGTRGAYLIRNKKLFAAGERMEWDIIADVGITQPMASELIKNELPDKAELDAQLQKSTEEMYNIAAKADGLQCTGNKMASAHHMSNVIFNDMRGGLFMNNYDFNYSDFIGFVKLRNKDIIRKNSVFFESVKGIKTVSELKRLAVDTDNCDIIRLCYEYLPLSFSRRHGDPSRPWNKFDIVIKDKNGNHITDYAGNWRDVFQNWEALCISFPEYLDSVIAKFVNATTADGYNAYRISKEGIDWERIEPDNPFSSFGYWGDHQIIYLSRLIEMLNRYYPEKLDTLMKLNSFSYANVPYEVADFEEMLRDCDHTLKFNDELDRQISKKVTEGGSDRRLLAKNGEIYHVAFAEKLIVPIMTKICALLPGGGVWMNTQRPEWNDANNAIVGMGLSVVTVCHLKRHISLCLKLFEKYKNDTFQMSNEVIQWLSDITTVLEKYAGSVHDGSINDLMRFEILKALCTAFDKYKSTLYKNGLSGKSASGYSSIIKLLKLADEYITYTLGQNKRSDGLYHSYNVMSVENGKAYIKHLKLMLEGQVAILGCDYLSSYSAIELMENMRKSPLYCEREKTYYLYPVIHTTPFMQKNIIKDNRSKLAERLVNDGDNSVFAIDAYGNLRFAEGIVCASVLKETLNELSEKEQYADIVKREYALILKMFDEVFKHSEFMGRSQVLYKYEGIGSIYWHQNSKLLVSVQEQLLKAEKEDNDRLHSIYNEVRGGLGFNKTPCEWGAFPNDSYSHTPLAGGAKQPVMTGQVKEEIITRFSELGVSVNDGIIGFDTSAVDDNEFLNDDEKTLFIGADNNEYEITVSKNALAFTFCQVIIVYHRYSNNKLNIYYTDGTKEQIEGKTLSRNLSDKIFRRSGEIKMIEAV